MRGLSPKTHSNCFWCFTFSAVFVFVSQILSSGGCYHQKPICPVSGSMSNIFSCVNLPWLVGPVFFCVECICLSLFNDTTSSEESSCIDWTPRVQFQKQSTEGALLVSPRMLQGFSIRDFFKGILGRNWLCPKITNECKYIAWIFHFQN